MRVEDVIAAIQADRVRVSRHAKIEAEKDLLTLEAVCHSVVHGEVIEDYAQDKPYPSCLIFGRTSDGEPVHSVWAYNEKNGWAVLITVYRPDPTRWVEWRERIKP